MLKFVAALLLIGSLGCALKNAGSAPAASEPNPPTKNERGPDGRSSVGNGNDFFDVRHGSAWFLGPRRIRYCFVVSPKFGVGDRSISETIEASFAHWRAYLRKKKFNQAEFHPAVGRQPGDPALLLNTETMNACDGTEDLKFYFGVEDDHVREYLRHYHRPIGISERTQYDEKTGWGKGFIWIAEKGRNGLRLPDWYDPPESFNAILMHEIGHVAGCGHVGGTVMDPDLTRLIQAQEKWEDRAFGGSLGVRLKSVDGWGMYADTPRVKELLLCEQCGFENPLFSVISRELHLALGGHDPGEGGRGIAVLHARRHFEMLLDFTLWSAFADRTRARPKTIRVRDLYPIARFADAAPVFKMVFRRAGENEPTTLVAASRGVVYVGRVTGVGGQELPVFLNRNTEKENFSVHVRLNASRPEQLYRLTHVLRWDGEDAL